MLSSRSRPCALVQSIALPSIDIAVASRNLWAQARDTPTTVTVLVTLNCDSEDIQLSLPTACAPGCVCLNGVVRTRLRSTVYHTLRYLADEADSLAGRARRVSQPSTTPRHHASSQRARVWRTLQAEVDRPV
ncbi:hypothetical protein EXIGLDRAFT_453432 [Exidia glandulosa HHB12029]|uniref:Uncharacterized protein n=1 Tax=Exidia glandulosa HHB12029 TaxID=1314781 RepID=A0A165B344_EXIGL|nr:hypothetical protein EXIGLDRAFT_453432 [Exidia glandulosa HHB12029]